MPNACFATFGLFPTRFERSSRKWNSNHRDVVEKQRLFCYNLFMKEHICDKCGGFVGEPNKAYGYVGKWCYCEKQVNPIPYTTSVDSYNFCPHCGKGLV